MMYRLFIFCLLLMGLNTSHAQFLNGAELLNECTNYMDRKFSGDNLCPAYIAGIANVHETLVNWGQHRREWCVPEDMENNQLVALINQDMRKQPPETLIYSADSLVAFSLVKLFPCR